MSSINLEHFRVRHPTEREALHRLEALLQENEPRRFSLDRLADRLDANSREELAMILAEMAVAGLIGFHFVVRSPRTNQPVKRFRELSEIPKTLRDADTTFVVEPEAVETEYEMPAR